MRNRVIRLIYVILYKRRRFLKDLCAYCKKPICPPFCPSFSDGVPLTLGVIGICFECGSRILRGEKFSYALNKFFCGDCAAEKKLAVRRT